MRKELPPQNKKIKGSRKETLLREKNQKGLFRPQELIALGVLILAVIILLAATHSFGVIKKDVQGIASHLQIGSENLQPKFQSDEKVQISGQASKSIAGKDLTNYQNWIGKVKSDDQVDTKDGKSVMTYSIKFSNGDSINGVKESDLSKAPDAKFKKSTTIQVSQSAQTDLDGYDLSDFRLEAAKVMAVDYNYSSGGGYKYDLSFDDGTKVYNVGESSLNDIYHVGLKESNSASQNNKILEDAFNYAKDNPGTILGLPSGNYTVGSQNPQSEYVTLASDTQIRGDNTKLIVDGTEYWFAFATGPGATDGVQNFTMRDITIQAKDLTKGDHFMIMANHGSNWDIANNTFTMVHKMGSHIFDLGGLQNSTFSGNTFEGYAPELTDKTEMSQVASDHDVYAEAIQFDTSDNKGEWDGKILQGIDPNYSSYNPNKVMTSNISVTGNSFIPYKDKSGKVIAYGASLGQHSGDVSNVVVTGNTFTSTLTSRFHQDTNWMFKPVHFTEASSTSVYGNTTN